MTKNLKVEYAHDGSGDHKCSISECTTSSIVEFETYEEYLNFIAACTYVYNREDIIKEYPNIFEEIRVKAINQ